MYNIEKLSEFIDDIINFKQDDIDIYEYENRKKMYISLTLDTKITNKSISFGLLNQTLILTICSDTGIVKLSRDEYKSFEMKNKDFSSKYYKILKDKMIEINENNLEKIINDSYVDLKIRRESNLNKLV